ncbi:MAG: hypothetical protein IT204_08330 [Fimbriimonadaceae bacterium]|nr:hypothetical protein [Fimbriimonadaceae bacterium]
MASRLRQNQSFLTDLFSGPFPGHGIIVNPPSVARPYPGDVCSDTHPIADWADWAEQSYLGMLTQHEQLDDQSVPYASLWTGTELFAAAFGCALHVYDDSPPAARPLVTTAGAADRLPQPSIDQPPLDRIWQLGDELRRRLGPQAILGVPDIQSPFDIAALIWNKQDLFLALYESPEAVDLLAAKCERLLSEFLRAFRERYGAVNYCHCPNAWAPPELGCWLSEDEAGCFGTAMFERFCLPTLTNLSQRFGGLFMHCCATADHQYDNFRRIPHLRGLNRVYQEPGAGPAITAFAGETVLIQAWQSEADYQRMLALAQPGSRFLFNLPHLPRDEAQRTIDRLRAAAATR